MICRLLPRTLSGRLNRFILDSRHHGLPLILPSSPSSQSPLCLWRMLRDVVGTRRYPLSAVRGVSAPLEPKHEAETGSRKRTLSSLDDDESNASKRLRRQSTLPFDTPLSTVSERRVQTRLVANDTSPSSPRALQGQGRPERDPSWKKVTTSSSEQFTLVLDALG